MLETWGCPADESRCSVNKTILSWDSTLSDILSRLSSALGDRYLLERELGQGGMATVYLARDHKHHRMVAIKVLRPELAASLGSERFLHEIEIAAGLQHPHILPLLDSGEADGFLYYVMPFVEGESLRERLDRGGELPVSTGVRILAEIAEALAYAHSRGVVHRDMKPENIMLSGRHPLVMDFGVAKAVSPATGSTRPTTAGVALGTPTYMAPEQAAADPHLDHRVDIYALGVIGYELLTGTTPFTGTSAQQILAAHMTRKPEPISVRRPAVPPGLAAILMRCLEKRPADRPQSAEELVRALEAVLTPGEELTPTDTRPVPTVESGISWRTLLIAGAILVVAIAGLLWQGGERSRPVLARHSQLTFVGNVEQPEISPDGQLLAYVERGDSVRLVVKDLTGGSTIPIAALGDWPNIRWSPDGASILHLDHLHEKWTTVLLPRLGGPPRPLPIQGAYGVLSPDGSQLATWFQNVDLPIRVTTLGTSAVHDISLPKEVGFRHEGDWSPDGHFIALLSGAASGNRSMLWAGNLKTGQWHKLVTDTVALSPPRWSAASDGLYYLQEQQLRKILTTPTGERRGEPEILQTGVAASSFSITSDGRKLVYLKEQHHSNLWLATRSRGSNRFSKVQLTRGTAEKMDGQPSPDGRLIAFVQSEQGRGDVFVVPVEGGVARRVTSSGVASGTPAWSRDGRHLAFIAAVGETRELRTITVEGDEERTYEHTDVSWDLIWAPYDRILYQRPGNRNYYWLDLRTKAETPLVANDSIGWIMSAIPSPDGRYIAVSWNRLPRRASYLISLTDGAQTSIGPAQVTWPQGWSSDGRKVFVEDRESRHIFTVSARSGVVISTISNPFINASCRVTEKQFGLALLCNVDESVSDVWMIENFDPALGR
jgi:eukaryotic-like serine/threonine-protein kinase